MARTGYKIVTYLDDNPYSPTYMETYEVREYDDVTCPTSDDNWVLITDECEFLFWVIYLSPVLNLILSLSCI